MIRLEEFGRIFMCLKFNYETHIKLTPSGSGLLAISLICRKLDSLKECQN